MWSWRSAIHTSGSEPVSLDRSATRLKAARFKMTVTLAAAALALTIGQAAANQAGQSYAGTWIADLTGTIYVRLELEGQAATLRGRIALGNIEVDKQGE